MLLLSLWSAAATPETVYGLGANALSESSVLSIFEVGHGRPAVYESHSLDVPFLAWVKETGWDTIVGPASLCSPIFCHGKGG